MVTLRRRWLIAALGTTLAAAAISGPAAASLLHGSTRPARRSRPAVASPVAAFVPSSTASQPPARPPIARTIQRAVALGATPAVPPPHAAPSARPSPAVAIPTPSPSPLRPVWLRSDDGRVDTGIYAYGDCSGRTPLSRTQAGLLLCAGGLVYIAGHSPGVFSALAAEQLGAGMTLRWSDGRRQRLVVAEDYVWRNTEDSVPNTHYPVELQTCITPDGSIDLIVSLKAAA